jgi:phospholipid-binding lipoprotein MlaA
MRPVFVVLALALSGCGTLSATLEREALLLAPAAPETLADPAAGQSEAGLPARAERSRLAEGTGDFDPMAAAATDVGLVAFAEEMPRREPADGTVAVALAAPAGAARENAEGGPPSAALEPRSLAQAPAPAEPSEEIPLEPASEEYDPWEPFNETMFEFNRKVDRYALKPVARAWDAVVPDELKRMLGRAVDNIRSVPRIVNNVLQGKLAGAGRETARFLINSVVGIGGLWDMAKQEWGIAGSPEDFGQTLGVAGSGPGPYLILPFLPPLTVRDGIGFGVDILLNPLTYLLPTAASAGITVGDRVNERALNLELFEGFEETTLDLYSAVRNAYLSRRKKQISE